MSENLDFMKSAEKYQNHEIIKTLVKQLFRGFFLCKQFLQFCECR